MRYTVHTTKCPASDRKIYWILESKENEYDGKFISSSYDIDIFLDEVRLALTGEQFIQRFHNGYGGCGGPLNADGGSPSCMAEGESAQQVASSYGSRYSKINHIMLDRKSIAYPLPHHIILIIVL